MAKKASTGKSIPSFVLIILLILLSLIVSCVLAPVVGFLTEKLYSSKNDFRIIFLNTALVVLLILCIAFRNNLRADIRGSLNHPFYKVLLHIFIGSGFALLFTALSAIILWVFKIKSINISFLNISWVSVLSSLAIVCFIEILFRGYILQSLVPEIYTFPAVLITNAIFAFMMLVYISGKPIALGSNVDFLLGFKELPEIFSNFGSFYSMIPALTGFFLMGVLFSLTYLKLGSLYASIGMFFIFFLIEESEIITIGNKLFKGRDIIFGSHGTILEALPGSIMTWILLLLGIIGFLSIGGISNKKEA